MPPQPDPRRVPADDSVFIMFEVVMDADQIESDASALRQGECETVSNLFDKLRELESAAGFSHEERVEMAEDTILAAFEPFLLLTTNGRLARHQKGVALGRLTMRLWDVASEIRISSGGNTGDGALRCKFALKRERVDALVEWLDNQAVGSDEDFAIELSRYFQARGWVVEPSPHASVVPLTDLHSGVVVLTRRDGSM